MILTNKMDKKEQNIESGILSYIVPATCPPFGLEKMVLLTITNLDYQMGGIYFQRMSSMSVNLDTLDLLNVLKLVPTRINGVILKHQNVMVRS